MNCCDGFPVALFKAFSILMDDTLERSAAKEKALQLVYNCTDFTPVFDVERRVYDFLDYLHIPSTMQGYVYFHRLFLLLYREPELLCDIGALCDRVALFYSSTTRNVLQCLYRCIQASRDRCPADRFEMLFSDSISVNTGLPTVSGFVISCVKFGFLDAELSS